jgi:hypothetical protein
VKPVSCSRRQKSLRGLAKCAPAAAETRPGLIPQKTTSRPGARTSGTAPRALSARRRSADGSHRGRRSKASRARARASGARGGSSSASESRRARSRVSAARSSPRPPAPACADPVSARTAVATSRPRGAPPLARAAGREPPAPSRQRSRSSASSTRPRSASAACAFPQQTRLQTGRRRYSYCSASSTFRRDARLAGKIAATRPTTTAATTKTAIRA